MKYQIFELIPNTRVKSDGWYATVLLDYTLEQGEYPDSFDTFDAAVSYIRENLKEFEDQKLTVLPIIIVDYEGKVEE